MKSEADRLKVIAQYRQWLWQQINDINSLARRELFAIAKRVKAGEKIRLVCWCKQPDKEVACHGDIIINAINWLITSNQV